MLENKVIKMKTQSEQKKESWPSVPNIQDNSPILNQRTPITTAEHRPAVIPGERTTNSNVDPCDAITFDLQTWKNIFQRCNLLDGILFHDKDLKPDLSRSSLWRFQKDESLLFKIREHFKTLNGSTIESHLANNEVQNTMIRNHCTNVDVNFQCPFVSFAGKFNQETQKTSNHQKKTLHTTCSWRYPRVKL